MDIQEKRVSFNFLNTKIFLKPEDRANFHIMLFLAMVEREEEKHKDGYLWYTTLRDKYSIRFDSELEKQIEDILMTPKSK